MLVSTSDVIFNMATTYAFCKYMSPTLGCSVQFEQVNLMGYPFIVFQQSIYMNLVLMVFSSLQCHQISGITFS